MARKLPHKDVVIIGLGWTGSILANELTDAGLDVVAIERGPWRDTATDFLMSYAQDELRYRIQHELFLRPSQMSVTFRNNAKETALPVRTWGAFMLGNGAGGAGVHWNAETWRFSADRFHAANSPDAALRRQYAAAGHDHSGLGHHLRSARAALRRFRVSVRHVGPSRQSQGGGPGRRQSIRGFAFAALSDAADETGLRPYAVCPGRERTWLQAIPAAVRQSVAVLHQSARRHARAMHLLWLLRMVRLRQLFQGDTADHGAAGAVAQIELRGAHRMRGDAHQSR